MSRSYRLRHAKYSVARMWRRSETPLFIIAVTLLVIMFFLMMAFLTVWALGGFGEQNTDLLSAIGAWAIGIAVPATGGIAAWRAMAAKERDRRQGVWRRAIQVAPRSPNLAKDNEAYKFDIWSIVVEPPQGVDLVQLMIGVTEGDIERGEGIGPDLGDERSSSRKGESPKEKSRETSYSDVHFGGRPYFHPHTFPRDVAADTSVSAEERYKKATSRLAHRKIIIFSVDGYRFVRASSTAYFMDEAPRDVYRAALRLEKRVLSSLE